MAAVMTAMLWVLLPELALALVPPQIAAAPQATTYHFAIVKQPLAAALRTWSSITGARIGALPPEVSAAPLATAQGQLSAAAALDALLRRTGLSFSFVDAEDVVLQAAPVNSGAIHIGTLRVEGTTASAPAGINGSTDPTATEGSGSYAADLTTVATKLPISLQETPQSVNVITAQEMQDLNITDFTQLMAQAPGITSAYAASNTSSAGTNGLMPTYYSRGFQVTRMQIDGGAPMSIDSTNPSELIPQINMAAYDHAEILSGADGMYNGNGDPGGVINLERKSPLNHQQLLISQDIGSWDNFNTTVDASSPIGSDDKLRARVVINRQTEDYFYDTANNRQSMIYAIVEALPTPSTTLSAGINYQTQAARPFYNGLPAEIADNTVIEPNLPRSTCLCFDWNRLDIDTHEVFARLDQSLGRNWAFRLDVDQTRQNADYSYGGVIGVIGSADPTAQPQLSDSYGQNVSAQHTADATLSGNFQLLGNRQTVVVGANYFDYDGGDGLSYVPAYLFGGPAVDVFNFNQADYPAPAHPDLPTGYTDINKNTTATAYASLRLTPWKPLHLDYGVHYNRVATHVKTHQVCRNDFGCFDPITDDFVDDGLSYDEFEQSNEVKSFFPAGYIAALYDINTTLTVYASRTAIYIDNSLEANASGKPLGPTTGNNDEVGLKFASRDHLLAASIAIFYVKQMGYPLQTGYFGVPGVNQNTGTLPDGLNCCFVSDPNMKHVSKGIDLELNGRITRRLQVIASYVYNDTQATPSQPVPGSLRAPLQSQAALNIYKVWTRYDFDQDGWLRGLYVGAGFNGQSSAFNGGDVCSTYNTEFDYCSNSSVYTARLAPYLVLSALAGYTFHDRYTVTLSIDNLTDRTYYVSTGVQDGGNWYGTPRSYTLSLRAAL